MTASSETSISTLGVRAILPPISSATKSLGILANTLGKGLALLETGTSLVTVALQVAGKQVRMEAASLLMHPVLSLDPFEFIYIKIYSGA